MHSQQACIGKRYTRRAWGLLLQTGQRQLCKSNLSLWLFCFFNSRLVICPILCPIGDVLVRDVLIAETDNMQL
jgi:hypothetical protein